MYTPTQWTEGGMTGYTKTLALNNLETVYSEVIAYYTSILHDTLYYQKAECDAKYFSASKQGPGSGFVAYFIDGQSYDYIVTSATPPGCIALWHGYEVDIPAGYHICNGTNGTPDLRNYFVVGAGGGSYNVGNSGGLDTISPEVDSFSVNTTSLTEDMAPAHTHQYHDWYNSNGPGSSLYGYPDKSTAPIQDHSLYTSYTGNGDPHGHSGSTALIDNVDNRPAYLSLAYIMKL